METLNIVLENWQPIVSLIVAVSCFFGYKSVKTKISEFDKDKKILNAVKASHKLLEAISQKTDTKIDDYIENALEMIIELLENKDEVLELTESDKEKIRALLTEKVDVISVDE